MTKKQKILISTILLSIMLAISSASMLVKANAQVTPKNTLPGISLITPLSTTITPTYSLDYSTPSSGWSPLSPSSWNRNTLSSGTEQFQYSAYNAPPNWDEWSCTYGNWNEIAAAYSGTTTCEYEQIMKGTINGNTQVFWILVDTQTVQTGNEPWAPDGESWTFTAYYQLNSGGWQSLGQWTSSSSTQPELSVQFIRMANGGTYDTVLQVVPGANLGGSSAYHDFSGFSFSTPSEEQINVKGDGNSQYGTEMCGYRNSDYLTYG